MTDAQTPNQKSDGSPKLKGKDFGNFAK